MKLPYETATSGSGAIDDLHKILTLFGCSRFGTMTDNEAGELIVQFSHRGRDVTIKASFRGYAAAYLKAHPYSYRTRKSSAEHEAAAMKQAKISVCSVLRDWVKGQITMIEIGALTFEGAFLGQILLPGTGKTVFEAVMDKGLLKLEGGKT